MKGIWDHVISKAPSKPCVWYFLDDQSSQSCSSASQTPQPNPDDDVPSEKGVVLVHHLLDIHLFNNPVSSGKIAERKLQRDVPGC